MKLPRHLFVYRASRVSPRPYETLLSHKVDRVSIERVIASCDLRIDPRVPVDVLILPVAAPATRIPCWRTFGRANNASRGCNMPDLVSRHGFRRVTNSLLVVREEAASRHKFIALFLTSSTDGTIKDAARHLPGAGKALETCVPAKDTKRWSAQASAVHRDSGDEGGYKGALYNEGLQWHRTRIGSAFGYFAGRVGDMTQRYLATMACTARAMTLLEQRHVPDMHALRCKDARRHRILGMLPNLPTALVPAHMIGWSRGFANDIHNDSAAKDYLESITYWRGPRKVVGERGGWGFCVWNWRLIFDLDAHPACNVYMRGREPHGTLCTGKRHTEHAGLGAVLIGRATVLSKRWDDFCKSTRGRLDIKFRAA